MSLLILETGGHLLLAGGGALLIESSPVAAGAVAFERGGFSHTAERAGFMSSFERVGFAVIVSGGQA